MVVRQPAQLKVGRELRTGAVVINKFTSTKQRERKAQHASLPGVANTMDHRPNKIQYSYESAALQLTLPAVYHDTIELKLKFYSTDNRKKYPAHTRSDSSKTYRLVTFVHTGRRRRRGFMRSELWAGAGLLQSRCDSTVGRWTTNHRPVSNATLFRATAPVAARGR